MANAWFRILGRPLDVVGEIVWIRVEIALVELDLSFAEIEHHLVWRRTPETNKLKEHPVNVTSEKS